MVKNTTLSSFQESMRAEREADEQPTTVTNSNGEMAVLDSPEGRAIIADAIRGESTTATASGFDLGAFAERMVSDREPSTDERCGSDPWVGLRLDVEPGAAIGLVEAQLRDWLEERGRHAIGNEIRHKADQLIADAEQRRPVGTNGTYTVDPSGEVTSFVGDQPKPERPPAAELPDMPLHALKVPSDSVFGDDGEFVISQPLTNRAQVLIQRHPEHFKHLAGHQLSVIYLWKKTGGKAKGRATFGKCSKPSGLLKHFSEAHFVIWLAADHCRAAKYRDRELEALLFHEMLHTAVSEVDENTGRGGGPTLVPHELEVFRAEVEIYGLWAPELKEVGPAFRQASLFDGPSKTECRGCRMEVQLDADGWCNLCSPPMAADEICDSAQVDDSVDLQPVSLVCSICKTPVDESEWSDEEIAAAMRSEAVVLCETCGEDGVIEGDDEADTPTLVCSECGEPVFHDQLTSEDAAKAETDPSVVLCEDCSDAAEAG